MSPQTPGNQDWTPSDELYELVDRMCLGVLDEAGRERLEALLREDENARLFYAEYVGMHADLHWRMRAGVMPGIPAATPVAEAAKDDRPATGTIAGRVGDRDSGAGWRRWAIAAAVLLTVGVAVTLLNREDDGSAEVTRVESPGPVATITDTSDADWSGGVADDMMRVGESVDTGALSLRSGKAQMLLGRGAVVTVVGPADWEMLDDNACRLTRGKLVAYVPDSAKGFTVHTPRMTVTDLGTRFGVVVDASGETEVHVLEGRVEVSTRADQRATLAAGQAARSVDRDATLDRIPAEPARFAEVIADGDLQLASFGFGTQRALRASKAPAAPMHADSLDYEGARTTGGSLVVGGAVGENTVYADLDVSPGGPFAAAGYIAGNGRIGANDTTLYISWLSRFEVEPGGAGGSVGLSLFDAGDDLSVNEPLFVGKASGTLNLSHDRTPEGKTDIDRDPSTADVDVIDASKDGRTHLWVMKVDFRSGVDRIEIYVDPESGEASKPNSVIESADLTFDRLRFVANSGNTAVYDEVRIGTSWRAVVGR